MPVCYVYHGDALYSPLDEKPKSVDPLSLKRVRNILENPWVALLVDRYSERWSELAYLMVRGQADLLEPGDDKFADIVVELREKYPQYREMAIETQPLIRLLPGSFSSWGNIQEPSSTGVGFLELMQARRSVRWYTTEPVPAEVVRAILEAGRWAPSPHGAQPWRFAVLTRQEAKARLAEQMSATWREQLALDGQPKEVVALRLSKASERLVGAPLVVILCLYLEDLDSYPDRERQRAETTMAIQSLGAAAENMLLTAKALGIDGGWMCAPLFCPETVCSALNLSEKLIPHAMLTFGRAAREPVRRERRPLAELIELYD